jgi:hypothetical protein
LRPQLDSGCRWGGNEGVGEIGGAENTTSKPFFASKIDHFFLKYIPVSG